MSYYANLALAGWESQQANYQKALDLHASQVAMIEGSNAAAQAAWEEAHAAWEADPGELPEPPQPPPQPTPAPPEPPDAAVVTVYEAREVTEPEELETATGTALILPPRFVLTGDDGVSFALSEQELSAGFVDTTTVAL